jgi:type I restriction enzyme S subunit
MSVLGSHPSPEQIKIAAFLDHETAKIDALVAEQRRLMELLKEKRQAVISHAVTKGLNPDVPMKPSGIEWLGDVPEHWSIGSLGYLASIQTGSTPDRGKPVYWEGDIPWLKTGEINYERILESEEFITEAGLTNSAARIADVGTLMMAMYGQGVTRGRVAILGIRAAYNQACAAITFGPKVFNEYARYFFMMAYRFIRDIGNETSQMNLGRGTIAKIKILIPSLEEQKQIVSLLQSELSVFDTLITEAQRAIDLLQERRTALISAAVTGQIDVRDLVSS